MDTVLIHTSPIPEDAPVMSATLPATFSMYLYLFEEKRNLRRPNVGIKSSNAMNVKGGSTMFKNLCSKSMIANLQRNVIYFNL